MRAVASELEESTRNLPESEFILLENFHLPRYDTLSVGRQKGSRDGVGLVKTCALALQLECSVPFIWGEFVSSCRYDRYDEHTMYTVYLLLAGTGGSVAGEWIFELTNSPEVTCKCHEFEDMQNQSSQNVA